MISFSCHCEPSGWSQLSPLPYAPFSTHYLLFTPIQPSLSLFRNTVLNPHALCTNPCSLPVKHVVSFQAPNMSLPITLHISIQTPLLHIFLTQLSRSLFS